MEGIVPHPPPQRAPGKKAARRMSHNSQSGKPSHSSLSRSGMYSSGVYSSRMGAKGGFGHGGPGDKHAAGGGAASKAHQLKVFDDLGNDVTPIPLLPSGKNGVHKGGGGGGGGDRGTTASYRVSQESAVDLLNHLESNTMASQLNSSTFGRSMFGSKASGNASMTDQNEDDTSSMASVGSDMDEEDVAPEYQPPERKVKHWTEAELSAPVSIMLSETDTIWLLEIPGVAIAGDSPDEPAVRAANERYKQLKATRATNDNFVDRGTQTFNYFSKNKDVQATILKQTHAECSVTDWSIYDTYAAIERKSAEAGDAEQETSTAPGLFTADEDYAGNDAPAHLRDHMSSASTLHMHSQSQSSYM